MPVDLHTLGHFIFWISKARYKIDCHVTVKLKKYDIAHMIRHEFTLWYDLTIYFELTILYDIHMIYHIHMI